MLEQDGPLPAARPGGSDRERLDESTNDRAIEILLDTNVGKIDQQRPGVSDQDFSAQFGFVETTRRRDDDEAGVRSNTSLCNRANHTHPRNMNGRAV
jgi:hypothetical protein